MILQSQENTFFVLDFVSVLHGNYCSQAQQHEFSSAQLLLPGEGRGGDVQHVHLDVSPSLGSRHPLEGGAVKVVCCSSGDRSLV